MKEMEKCQIEDTPIHVVKEFTLQGAEHLSCGKPHIKDIIECFCRGDVYDEQVIKTCVGHKLFIKGEVCIKVHYCSTCVCGVVVTEVLRIPFYEVIEMEDDKDEICTIDVEIPFCDLTLLDADEIGYFVILCIRVKRKRKCSEVTGVEVPCEKSENVLLEELSKMKHEMNEVKQWKHRVSKEEKEQKKERNKENIRQNLPQKGSENSMLRRWGRKY